MTGWVEALRASDARLGAACQSLSSVPGVGATPRRGRRVCALEEGVLENEFLQQSKIDTAFDAYTSALENRLCSIVQDLEKETEQQQKDGLENTAMQIDNEPRSKSAVSSESIHTSRDELDMLAVEREELKDNLSKIEEKITARKKRVRQVKEEIDALNQALQEKENAYQQNKLETNTSDASKEERASLQSKFSTLSPSTEELTERQELEETQAKAEQLELQLTLLEENGARAVPLHADAEAAAEGELKRALGEIQRACQAQKEELETVSSRVVESGKFLESVVRSCSLTFDRTSTDGALVKSWIESVVKSESSASKMSKESMEKLKSLGLIP